jgi:hypothetical protein
MASDLLSTIRSEIDERLHRLRPALAEYEQLLIAIDALVEAGEALPSKGLAAPPPAPRAARESPRVSPRVSVPPKRKPAIAGPVTDGVEPKRQSPRRSAMREAILAALDHGSHTVGELVVVTAASAPNLNGNLRRMIADGVVMKIDREGKTAYALAKRHT